MTAHNRHLLAEGAYAVNREAAAREERDAVVAVACGMTALALRIGIRLAAVGGTDAPTQPPPPPHGALAMSDYLRRCSRCGYPVYRFDPCPRTYLHPKETP